MAPLPLLEHPQQAKAADDDLVNKSSYNLMLLEPLLADGDTDALDNKLETLSLENIASFRDIDNEGTNNNIFGPPPSSSTVTTKDDNDGDSEQMGVSIPIRPLAWVVLTLLIASHVFLFHQCHVAYSTTKIESFFRGRYKVIEPTNNASQRSSTTKQGSSLDENGTKVAEATAPFNILGEPTTEDGGIRNTLQPGDICETLEHDVIVKDDTEFYRTIYPTAGFVSKHTMKNELQLIHYYNTTNPATYNNRNDDDDSTSRRYISNLGSAGWCPLVYAGWWPGYGPNSNYTGWSEHHDHDHVKPYLYAPTALIVSQCLWNGCQVLYLFLILALVYGCCCCVNMDNSPCQKYLVSFVALASAILLPFSVYVISLGGHIFATLTFVTTLLALLTPGGVSSPALFVSVGESESESESEKKSNTATTEASFDDGEECTKQEDEFLVGSVSRTSSETMSSQGADEEESDSDVEGNHFLSLSAYSFTTAVADDDDVVNDSKICNDESDEVVETGCTQRPPLKVIREETVGFLGNLFCHMYNYRQPWKSFYFFVDGLFGWQTVGDVTPTNMYTMGFPNTRIPLFVSQSSKTTMGAHTFLGIWSILPFLYVTYFGIMYLVAIKSPGVTIQRIICLWSMFHFLFLTDVVAYRYGRGYRSTHEDIFHWSEHFAWRAAILLPIYQNLTNGHWFHPKYPKAGLIFRIVVAAYGVYFLLFQVVQGDVFQFVTFSMGSEDQSTLFDLIGWDDNAVVVAFNLNDPKKWVTLIMTILYGFLHISGFPLFWVCVRRRIDS